MLLWIMILSAVCLKAQISRVACGNHFMRVCYYMACCDGAGFWSRNLLHDMFSYVVISLFHSAHSAFFVFSPAFYCASILIGIFDNVYSWNLHPLMLCLNSEFYVGFWFLIPVCSFLFLVSYLLLCFDPNFYVVVPVSCYVGVLLLSLCVVRHHFDSDSGSDSA